MKLKLHLMTLFTVIYYENVDATCDDIGTLVGETKKDVYERPTPITLAGKCIFECMMSRAGWLDNGLIKPDKFMDSVRAGKNFPETVLEKIKTATERCKNHRHLSENKCETVGLFVQCSSEEVVKLGLNATDMSEAIWATFIFLPFNVTNPNGVKQERKGTFLFDWPDFGLTPKINKN